MRRLLAILLCLWPTLSWAQFNGTSGIYALNHMTFGLMSTGLTIVTGGTGYALNNTITLDCPDNATALTTKPIITVTGVTSGAVTSATITNPGFATSIPSTNLAGGANGVCTFTQLSTSGAGQGATFYGAYGFSASSVNGSLANTTLLGLDNTWTATNLFQLINIVPSSDGAIVTTQNSYRTAFSIYSPLFGPSVYVYGNNRSVIDIEPGATNVVNTAYDAYVWNATPLGGGNGVATSGFFTIGINAANGANTWAWNSTLLDSPDHGTTHFSGNEIQWEADSYVYDSGTAVEGVAMGIGGPANPASGNGFQCGQIGLNPVAKWSNCYVSNSGASSVGMILGNLYAPFVAGHFTIGTTYSIVSVGTTDFTLIGASSNTPGTSFTATGVGTGTGTATVANAGSQPTYLSVNDSTGAAHYLELSGGPSSTDLVFAIQDKSYGANYIFFQTGRTGHPVEIGATGTDSGVNLLIATKAGDIYMDNRVLPYTNGLALGNASFSWAAVNSTVYNSGTSGGVTCATGSPTSSFATVGGIVTHC